MSGHAAAGAGQHPAATAAAAVHAALQGNHAATAGGSGGPLVTAWDRSGADAADGAPREYGAGFRGGFARFRQADELADVTVVVTPCPDAAGDDGSAAPAAEYRLHSLLLAYHSAFFAVRARRVGGEAEGEGEGKGEGGRRGMGGAGARRKRGRVGAGGRRAEAALTPRGGGAG